MQPNPLPNDRGLADIPVSDWQRRLAVIVETVREMSLQSDPQAMVRAYGERVRSLFPTDRFVALSRRDLDPPRFRVTRSSLWERQLNPWTERDHLPILEGGLLGELIYGDEPRIIDHLDIADDDPGAEYLAGMGSLLAIPNYDRGAALNMTVLMRTQPAAFDPEQFPEHVWMSNLFGRATHSLVLAEEVRRVYELVDRELKVVADIQRSLLPKVIPKIPTLHLAAYYQTSRRAGGDYYDFFPLSEGRWGLLIADVSGHGVPAAVMMAITHSIAHAHPGPPDPPSRLLTFVNNRLADHYTADNETFVTAFYAVYDPARSTLTYSSAGHNPPLLRRADTGLVTSLDGLGGLPLGVVAGQDFAQFVLPLFHGDQLLFYTDGITEATNPAGQMFGLERLDALLSATTSDVDSLVHSVLSTLDRFTAGQPPADDQTLLAARVS
ncbi:MAG: PP2C family protein-serine/threonine phosphatase [Isosphaeraceae bacterium]